MKILVADDEKNIREALVKLLKASGWEAEAAENGLAAQRRLQEQAFAGVIADLKMPGMDGLELLTWCRAYGPDVPFVMISAHGEIADAVEAMKRGAHDYITKPFDPDELDFRLRQALEAHRDHRIARSVQPLAAESGPGPQSPAWKRIDALVRKAAPTTSLILITGESGTGKEVLARRIHADSAFASGPFLAINIGGIPENLLESELFGFEKGSFTGADKRKNGLFELASEGTLFLDEIGEMPMPLQVKLLRVLQERKIQRIGGTVQIPVESRILAATNRNLSEEVKAGRFREDLFYRLNVVPILVPPLRERAEDLPWLCSRLLEKLAKSMGKKVTGLTTLAMNRLRGYSFPGNIRELENLLERALIFAEGEVITEEDLDLPKTSSTVVSTEEILSAPSLGSTLWELERRAITECLLKWEGNQTKAAEELGITRRTMFNKIKEYGLAISG
jgi:two-component system response regulator AtoC